MIDIIAFVRYSTALIVIDKQFYFGLAIFLLLCGILIFQNGIWEEEDYLRNKKWLTWKKKAISLNKSDLSKIYPAQSNQSNK